MEFLVTANELNRPTRVNTTIVEKVPNVYFIIVTAVIGAVTVSDGNNY